MGNAKRERVETTQRTGGRASLTAFILCLLALPAFASEGLYLLGTDALQLGRADSGTASPRSAYWLFMNPASIVDLDRRVDFSVYGVLEKIDLQPRGIIANPFDGRLNGDGEIAMPGSGIIWPLDEGRGTLGAALYVMGGADIQYDKSRTILGRVLYGNRDRKQSIRHLQLALGYAYEFDNGWAVGAGLYGSALLFRTDQLTLGLRPAEADYHWDEAFGVGFSVGVYRNWEKWAVGAMYRSPQWMERLDDYSDLLYHSLDYPQSVRVGVAWRPVDKLELTLDYEFQQWSKTETFGNTILNTGLKWDDVHGIKAGIEYKLNDQWTLMAGYSFADTVIDDDHLFVNSLVPTLIEHHWTVGVSYTINEHHRIHMTYVRSAENSLTDSGHGDILSRVAGGSELTVSGDSLALGYTYTF